MMLLVDFFFVLPFAISNYNEYDYDSNSNYNSNARIEDCSGNGPESDQLSENNCFCYDEPEVDIPYVICNYHQVW